MRILGWLVAGLTALAGLLLVAVMGVLLAVGNEAASRWLLERAAPLVPGELALVDIDGNLLDGIHAGELRYRLDDLVITARDVFVRIRWPDLVERRVTVRQLQAAELAVSLPASADATERAPALPPIRLPVDLRLDQVAVELLRLQLAGLDESATGLRGRAAWTGDEVRVADLQAVARGVTARAAGQVRFAGDYPLDLSLQWDAPDLGLSGDGRFRGDLQRLLFQHRLQVPETVKLQGELLDLVNSPAARVQARWNEISRELAGVGLVSLRDGKLDAQGTLDAYQLELSVGTESDGMPAGQFRLKARGDLERIELADGVAEILGGRARVTGRLGFEDQAVEAVVELDGVDPGMLRADLAGRLNARARVQGRLPDRFEIELTRLDGEFRGLQLQAGGRIRVRDEQVTVSGFELASGENRLSIDGDVWPRPAGRFAVSAIDLAALWPGLSGQLRGRGIVGGTLRTPVLDVDLEGAGLAFAGQRADAVSLQGRLNAADVDLRLRATGVASGEQTIGTLSVRAGGTLRDHRVTANLDDGPVQVALQSAGSWDGVRLTEKLLAGRVDVGLGGEWLLVPAADLQTDGRGVKVTAHCWRQRAASLCVGDLDANPVRLALDLTLQQFPLDSFTPLLGEEFQVEGTANATLVINRDNDGLMADLEWVQTGTRIVYQPPGGEVFDNRLEEVRVWASLAGPLARFDARVRGDYGIEADAAGSIADPLSADAQLDMRLRVAVPDLGAPTPLINRYVRLDALRGRVDADLRLRGPLGAPAVEGEARLAEGFAYVPQAGIDLQDVSLTVTGEPGRPARLAGVARSGGGQVELDGIVAFADGNLYTEFTVTGEEFQALRFPEQSVWVSPNLVARIDAQQVRLSGTVTVPRAEILVNVLPETATTPSPDTVIHEADAPRTRAQRLELVGKLEVIMGPAVRFEAFGLTTRLGGSLLLQRSPGDLSANGEGVLRTVEGRFVAYGKELTIDRGSLIFSGPIDDPNLDVRASRRVEYADRDYRVGVLLTGLLSNIQTAVFSEPAVSEANALSLLILDRPLERDESAGSPELTGAAVALGLTRVLPITEQLEENLGLDEVSFEGMGGDDTAVVAGKRLGKDLFLRFSYGLFNQIGTFIVRYRIGGGFSIEAGSGQEQTLDLIYSIDR